MSARLEKQKTSALVLSADNGLRQRLATMLEQRGYAVSGGGTVAEAFDRFFHGPPNFIILDYAFVTENIALMHNMKTGATYSQIPLIVCMPPDALEQDVDWDNTPADDFFTTRDSDRAILARIKISLTRAHRDVNANPLSGLPGNVTIAHEAEKRLTAGDDFAFAYLDIDGFKAFNDKYGFGRGDEVLRMTARLVVNAIRSLGTTDTYVGHVGGDDFVFIVPSEVVSEACEKVIESFSLIVPNFYDEEDRVEGLIRAVDRQGNERVFPLMTVSIGVVNTHGLQLKHIGELFTRVAEVKSFAKSRTGSFYVVDRRK